MRYIFFSLIINLLFMSCENGLTSTKKATSNLPRDTLISQADSGLAPSVYDVIAVDTSTTDAQKNAIIDGVKEALKEKNLFVRERAIKETLKKIGGSSDLPAIEKKLIDGEEKGKAFFDQQSQNLAKDLLAQAQSGLIIMPPTRIQYLQVISAADWVIGGDIDRLHGESTRVFVGNNRFSFSENTPTLERFRQLSEALEKYVAEQSPNSQFSVGMGKIGPFWNSEIIASIGQGLIFDTLKKASETGILSRDRAINPNDPNLIHFFTVENGNMLKHRFQSNQSTVNPDKPLDETQYKPISYIVDIFFDLLTGEIKVERAYTLAGKTTRWSGNP